MLLKFIFRVAIGFFVTIGIARLSPDLLVINRISILWFLVILNLVSAIVIPLSRIISGIFNATIRSIFECLIYIALVIFIASRMTSLIYIGSLVTGAILGVALWLLHSIIDS